MVWPYTISVGTARQHSCLGADILVLPALVGVSDVLRVTVLFYRPFKVFCTVKNMLGRAPVTATGGSIEWAVV